MFILIFFTINILKLLNSFPLPILLSSSDVIINESIFQSEKILKENKFGSIIINSTTINCTTPDHTGCEIIINSSNSIIIENSTLYGSLIKLYSNEIFLINSEISTNGTISEGLGYTNITLQGYAYAAIGSICIRWEGVIDNSYGSNCMDYSEIDNDYDFIKNYTKGSGGLFYQEFGGGTILIKSNKQINLIKSIISASGSPLNGNSNVCNNRTFPKKGGTGGFILLESESIISNSQNSKINIEGGYYCGN